MMNPQRKGLSARALRRQSSVRKIRLVGLFAVLSLVATITSQYLPHWGPVDAVEVVVPVEGLH